MQMNALFSSYSRLGKSPVDFVDDTLSCDVLTLSET